MIRSLAAICVFASMVSAQNQGVINPQRVSPAMMYHRVYAVTPLIGGTSSSDPKRPMFIPVPVLPQKGGTVAPVSAPLPGDRSGILGYQMQLSDDGRYALVEYVVANPATFQAIMQKEAAARSIAVPTSMQLNAPASPTLAAPSTVQSALEAAVPGLKIFERGKATDSDILTEFRKYKTNYPFSSNTVRPQ